MIGPSTPLPIYTDIEVRELPDPDWLVEELFLSTSLVALYGSSGHGKTFVSLDLCFSIGTGRAFHGSRVVQGDVVYVYAEGAPSLKFRVEALKRANDWPLEEAANIWFIPTSVDLAGDDEDDLERLVRTIKAVKVDPAVVVIDTLARCFGSADENATQAMNRFTNRCAAIKDDLGATVLVVHHTGWEEGRERGNKSLRNNFDTVIGCSMSRGGHITLKCVKQKDAAPFDPLALRLDEVQLSDDRTSCVVRSKDSDAAPAWELDPEARTALEALDDLGEDGATYGEWLALAKEAGLTKSTFKRRRSDLVESGFVTAPPENSRGFRYQLMAKGRAALDGSRVQEDATPTADASSRLTGSGSQSVPAELLEQWAFPVGSNSGSNGSKNPSTGSGSNEGAYKAPHDPEAPTSGGETDATG